MPADPFYTFPDDDIWDEETPAEPLRMFPGGGQVSHIPTWYGGKLYRSRLEARWARWFEGVTIAFRHEEQPYGVDGEGFLPDFRLPDRRLDVEIKKGGFVVDDSWQRKLQTYADGSEQRLLLIIDWPEVAKAEVEAWYGTLFLPRRMSMPAVFAECTDCHRVGVLAFDGTAYDRSVWVDTSHCQCRHASVLLCGPRINQAIADVIGYDWDHSR